MSDLFVSKDSSFIRKEREIARSLKKTRWWRERLQKGICYHCEKKFVASELTMDHLVPLAKGGRSGKNNVVVCCKLCNSRKSYKTLVEIKLKNL